MSYRETITPFSLKLAVGGYLVSAALSALLGFVLVLIGRLYWPLLIFVLFFDGIPVWIAMSLWQRRSGVLMLARVLTGIAVLGSLSMAGNTNPIIGQPMTSIVRVLALVLQVVILSALFWPSTTEAFKQQR